MIGDVIPRYCKPCGENLLPDDSECPFCGQVTTPVDEMSEQCSHCGRLETPPPFVCGKGGCPLGGDL